MTLMECLKKLNVTALSGRGSSDKQESRHNHSSEELPVWCLTDIIFYQDSFPTRLIYLTWFSLSLPISIFIWQCANAVAESEDRFSLCNLCLLVVILARVSSGKLSAYKDGTDLGSLVSCVSITRTDISMIFF